jgi:cysteine-rich repeat protein/parallel beta-helix repeat protein
MEKRGLFLFGMVFLVFLALDVSGAECGGSVPCNCGDSLTSDYVMTSDLEGCGLGINIQADNIVLDCDNHKITANNAPNSIGISLSNRNGVTIKNCEISGFDIGVSLYGSNSNQLRYLVVHDNGVGISVGDYLFNTYSGSDNNHIGFSIIENNSVGIKLKDSNNNVIEDDNKIQNNECFGIWFNGLNTGNTVFGNRINNNGFLGNDLDKCWYGGAGVRLESGDSSNTISSNLMEDNGVVFNADKTGGIILDGASSNTIELNSIKYNGDPGSGVYEISGVILDGAGGNVIGNGNQIGGYKYGIKIIGSSSSNQIVGNGIGENSASGVYISGTGSKLNSIRDNNIYSNCIGIWSYGITNSNTIDGNSVFNNGLDCEGGGGIYLWNGVNSYTITNNEVNNNKQYGIYLMYGSGNTISNNVVDGMGSTGIGINLEAVASSVINNNEVKNSSTGVRFGTNIQYGASSGNTFSNNNICGNSVYGLSCEGSGAASGSGNTLDNKNGNGCPSVQYDECGGTPITESVCGNGILEEGEECDDGNTENGDGCSSSCLVEDNGEAGQDGGGNGGGDGSGNNGGNGGGSGGSQPYCGDGIISYTKGEYCDINNDDYSHCYQSQEYMSDSSLGNAVASGCEKISDECKCVWSEESADSNLLVSYSFSNCYCPEGRSCLDGIGVSDKVKKTYNFNTNQESVEVVGSIKCFLKVGRGAEKSIPFIDKVIFPFLLIGLVVGFFLIVSRILRRKAI